MQTVADDLRGDAAVVEHGADHTRLPVGQPRHGVVKVGNVGNAQLKRAPRSRVVRGRMGDGHGAEPGSPADEFVCSGTLGGNIHQLDDPAVCIVKVFELCKVRVLYMLARLRALAVDGNIGSFHIHSGNRRALGRMDHAFPDAFQRLGNPLVGNGHRSRAEGSNALLYQLCTHFRKTGSVRVTGVRTHAAVDMDIDKARHNHTSGKIIFLFCDGGNFIPLQRKIGIAQMKTVVYNFSIFQNHRITPPLYLFSGLGD